METQSKPDLERSLSRQFAVVADDARVARTATAREANGISVVRIPGRITVVFVDEVLGF